MKAFQRLTQQQKLGNSSERQIPISEAAVNGTELLAKFCRFRKDIPDMRVFVFAITYVLNGHSDEVIRWVTDPAKSPLGRLRYPLEVADVRRACEERQATLAFEEKCRRDEAVAAAAAAAAAAFEERRRAEQEEEPFAVPDWPSVAAFLQEKLRPANFKTFFKGAKLGPYDPNPCGSELEIILLSLEAREYAQGVAALVLLCAQKSLAGRRHRPILSVRFCIAAPANEPEFTPSEVATIQGDAA
jgi:hypothetical protein